MKSKSLLVLFVILFVRCSSFESKLISEKLTDDELISSVSENDSTIILFHSKLNGYRDDILQNDIERIKYSEVKYIDIINYLNTKYRDSTFNQKVNEYFEKNKPNYYNEKYEKVDDLINQIFTSNKKIFDDEIIIEFNGLDRRERLTYLVTLKNKKREFFDFDIYTIVNGDFVKINFDNLWIDTPKKLIKSKLPYFFYLPSGYSNEDKTKLLGQLKLISYPESVVYSESSSILGDEEFGIKNRFNGYSSSEYAFKLLNYSKLDSTHLKSFENPEFLYRDLSEEELNTTILHEWELFKKFRNDLLNDISNFKVVNDLLSQINFHKEYSDYLDRNAERNIISR
jgi:hypothetical protein